MSILRSEQLIEYAQNEYIAGRIDADELEDRIHRALTGEGTDQEWIAAARNSRDEHTRLKAHYLGPISV